MEEAIILCKLINTPYMRNSSFVYVLKMEYVPKINIFGLKMMVTIHHNFEFAILQLFMR